MNAQLILRHSVFLLGAFGFIASGLCAAPLSDISSPEARRTSVELAQRLAKPSIPEALPSNLVQPFNPLAFNQPDAEELRAIAAARAAAVASAAENKPSTDRELLQLIAERITPSGTLILGGEPMLIFGQKRLRVGDRLTVSYDGQDYDIELTAIDRIAFTIRLNHDEITRQIKPGKSQ